MQTDILTWFLIILTTVTIVSLIWLIIYSLRSLKNINILNNDNNKATNKLYRARFAIGIISPLITFVSTFFIVIYYYDNFTDTMMLSGGPFIIAFLLASTVENVVLFILSYININQIKSDLSSKPNLTNTILRSSKKLLYLTRIYAVIIILPLLLIALNHVYYIVDRFVFNSYT